MDYFGYPRKSRSAQYSRPKKFQTSPVPCKLNPNIVKTKTNARRAVTYRNVHPTEDTYNDILSLITNQTIVVENLVQINNPYLKSAYDLKKEQKVSQYGNKVSEKLLFHGTRKENLDSICTWNFNWRFFGESTGHKFGQGVSFSPNAMYASNYSDTNCYNKVMIIAKVLIAQKCQGNENMVLPLDGCDTSQKNNGIVIVKYEDHEFLPLYKMYYHIAEYSDSEEQSDEDSEEEESWDEEDGSEYEEEEDEGSSDEDEEEEDCEEESEDYDDEEDSYDEEDYYDSEEYSSDDYYE
ncbi:hypothetical protein Zmor_019477 [Zophobas morio]|uniref:Poly [ADP-ribose] polymerase n=1 Tax=Zophobas morio TaxID=2755281 RepID=A0AA38I4K4_9CUCU|nr:hypothetical protein Zmor_019477 [Zophobas morio]